LIDSLQQFATKTLNSSFLFITGFRFEVAPILENSSSQNHKKICNKNILSQKTLV